MWPENSKKFSRPHVCNPRMSKREVYVGTSGYDYYWNKRTPSAFEWYCAQGFNSVEVNATFYRYPTERMAKVWARAPQGFAFSVKVHRSITHYSKLSDRAPELWEAFTRPLRPLQDKVAFWLYQLPPSYHYSGEALRRLKDYFSTLKHPGTPVVEFRSPEWWAHTGELEGLGVAFCSVSAPRLPEDLVELQGVVYLRLHGRTEWYSYVYDEGELDEILDRLERSKATKIAVYFNNDLGMFENALYAARRLLR